MVRLEHVIKTYVQGGARIQALADVSEVLTPEQRQALIARHHRQGS